MTVSANLIINADDYGYSDGVSRGILKAVEFGTVKATGVLANSPDFEKHCGWLKKYESLDVGVHLTLTSDRPLSNGMAALMRSNEKGLFPPNKFSIASAVLTKKIPLHTIQEEWEMQISRCLAQDIRIIFINSHEHLHALPFLFPLVEKLAEKYGIPHVRVPAAEWLSPYTGGSIARSIVLMFMGWLMNKKKRANEPEMIGVSCSGKLNKKYVKQKISLLTPGKNYELMCHPGYYKVGEIVDTNLLAYHDWEGELNTLCDHELLRQLRKNDVNLIGYRDL